MASLPSLLKDVRACTLCSDQLPHGVRPVLQADSAARILIAGQAPGRKVHETGIPFDDASGQRLREWLGVSPTTFYDAKQIAILPMGFCYPGTGKSGDLPPLPLCAETWRARLLATLKRIELILVIGQYAIQYHLPEAPPTVTETVRGWRQSWPKVLPLPHPSPRNNIWLRKNPWFEEEVLPSLRARVTEILEN